MERILINQFVLLLIGTISFSNVSAQDGEMKRNYIGVLPSILVEPYDMIDAVEINILPFVYEYRFNQGFGLQLRPIMNYRIVKMNPGISQTGGTIMINKYLRFLFREDYWLTPQIGIFYTDTYNQIDRIRTMTLGLEPGISMRISASFSLNLNLQPGINYYPNEYSKQFVDTETGFKSHFGVIFHLGFSF